MAKMGLSEEPEDTLADESHELLHKHHQLVKELNLDEETASLAWTSFRTIRTNYTLEGDDLHWLGCAIFVSCRNTVTPTLSRHVVKCNPISLTSLLRFCNLSVTQFFHKIDAWIDMAKLQEDDDFKKKVQKLQENFVITCNVYKEYFPTFEKIFNSPDMQAIRHRNRKQRTLTCTPTKVFEFTWLLFITIKAKNVSNNIITAYHFLLACFDLIFKNALLGNHRELLNQNFEGLPLNWSLPGSQVTEAPCIIGKLLSQRNDMLSDAVYEKEYTVKRYVQELIDEGVLHANPDTLTELLDPANFEHNCVNIGKAYDQLILTESNIDERIFLAECQRQYIIQNSTATNGNLNAKSHIEIEDTAEEDLPRINSGGEVVQHCPPTPLSGRRYLRPREQNESIISAASQSIARLNTVLADCSAEPSDNLSTIFKSCDEDPVLNINSVLEKLNQKFLGSYREQIENVRPNSQNDGERKVELATMLYYKLLENMLVSEKNVSKVSLLLAKDLFHECLYACSLEIVLFSYNCQNKFPWILDILKISALDLVRVIELIVRSKDQLSRDTIKHLSYVEESILEWLMWKSDSVLWENIKKWGDIPKFEDVALPSSLLDGKRSLFSPGTGQSPGPSAVETFQSPINVQVKKQLFPNVRPGQSLLQNNRTIAATHLMVTDQDGNRKLIPLEQSPTIIPSSPVAPPAPEPKPKKVGSHFIIYRKFYNLAGIRLDHLCNKLGITEDGLKRKIWTVFEYSIRKNTDLLRDRHLDQLLMCAVYVICKITGNSEKNFSEIMKCYRVQPQANSDIYRNVLINGARVEDGESIPETRSSLIEFYNNIYVQVMKNFVVLFSHSKNQDDLDIMLSPLPSVRSLLASPRHQVMKNVFVRPYESPNNTNKDNINSNSYSYLFSRSASKDLKDINRAINGSCVSGKRLLADSFESLPNKKFANRKMQALIEERKVQNTE